MWHNDTVNIWSHIIGLIICIVLFMIEVNKENETGLNKFPIYVFYIGSAIMFISSSTMHLLYCKSKKTCNCVVKLDFSGIALCAIGKLFYNNIKLLL